MGARGLSIRLRCTATEFVRGSSVESLRVWKRRLDPCWPRADSPAVQDGLATPEVAQLLGALLRQTAPQPGTGQVSAVEGSSEPFGTVGPRF